MGRPADSFVAYLAAKRTVDDRAIHRPTFDRLADELDARAAARGDDPVRILEVGVGIGTMIERLRAWEALPDHVAYVGVDVDEDAIAAAADRLQGNGFEAVDDRLESVAEGRTFRRSGGGTELSVTLQAADAFVFAADRAVASDADEPAFDLLIGMAFLDIVDFDRVAETLLPLLDGGGLGYFPITFDGVTVFEPVADPDREARLCAAYHAAMDAPDRPGGSHTGRRLLSALPAAGAERLAAGGSDWVVTPDADGGYPAAEADFLRHIVGTVAGAVETETPVEKRASLTDREVAAWADRRRAQIDRGELVYVAHNLDHLIRMP